MSNMILTDSQIADFDRQGFLIIQDFVRHDIADFLIERANGLMDAFNPDQIKTIFSTTEQLHAKQRYFLDSGDKIRFFFEKGALSDTGELIYEKKRCINKIGHALHELDPVFYCFSHSHKIIQLANDLSIFNPLIMQSMYICKQPHIGDEVTCHQDSTYLYVKDQPITGLWFALENATLNNGCLWVIPGGHKTPLKSRLRRKMHETSMEIYDDSPWPLEKMVPLEVNRGSLIVLHGLLPHMSKENTSSASRHAYTLHLMPEHAEFAADNWLQHIR